jgi:hypothetical protein
MKNSDVVKKYRKLTIFISHGRRGCGVAVMVIASNIMHPLPCDDGGTAHGAPDFSRAKQQF